MTSVEIECVRCSNISRSCRNVPWRKGSSENASRENVIEGMVCVLAIVEGVLIESEELQGVGEERRREIGQRLFYNADMRGNSNVFADVGYMDSVAPKRANENGSETGKGKEEEKVKGEKGSQRESRSTLTAKIVDG